jgi:tRNA threonylcarbamoyladenosine biosynthesis protein TsaB
MKILAVDTSTLAGSIALLEDERLLAEVTIEHPIKHTERLIPSMQYMLEQLRLEPASLEALAVGLGPGSFTGLRIGLATMKGMALSLGIPLVGVSSLEAIARGLAFAKDPVWAVIDARKGQVFAALYQGDDQGNINRVGDELVLMPEELAERIRGKAILAGGGARLYREIFQDRLVDQISFAQAGHDYPRASQVGLIALERLLRGERDDPDTLVPHYVREADAILKTGKHPSFH